MNKIIHITGTSGSGKSTLGQIIESRFKNVMVIDTDDIDDSSFNYLFENDNEFRNSLKSGSDDAEKKHIDLNIQKRDKIIQDNKDKNIVFVGLTVSLDDIDHIGYFLDTSLNTNFRQANLRTLKDIVKNYGQLEKLYQEEDIEFIDILTLYQYKIRLKFPVHFDEVKDRLERMKKISLEKNYKVMTGQEILDDLRNILEPIIITDKNIIIHIAGSQGSGKSHMGDKFKLIYGDLIHVEDLDNLYSEFLKDSKDGTKFYQNYLDEFIKSHNDKPLIIVGLDAELCKGTMKIENKDRYYDLHTNYNFFIDTDDNLILKQRFFRQIDKLSTRREDFFENWLNNPDSAQEKLNRFVNLNKWKINNKECLELYQHRKYEIGSYDEIFNRVKQLLMNQDKLEK
jgi:uridine kinase